MINRLNVLRGKGMASLYSWSCKRSYKNGFVWHDLSHNDFIYPAHDHEYVLKGSELSENIIPQPPPPLPPPENHTTGGDDLDKRRRHQSCSSIDFNNLHEYTVHKTQLCATSSAATQTDDNRLRRRRAPPEEEKRDEIEISPPPSNSSPETLETLMKAGGRGRLISHEETTNENPTVHDEPNKSGGSNKSSVLMQLISCGKSISFKDCGAGQGMGLIGQYKTRVTRGTGSVESGRVKVEEKEYFSGSLIETTKIVNPAGLKRSTSYNADR